MTKFICRVCGIEFSSKILLHAHWAEASEIWMSAMHIMKVYEDENMIITGGLNKMGDVPDDDMNIEDDEWYDEDNEDLEDLEDEEEDDED